MNNKFKVGDRVRIIESYNGAPYDVDDIGTVQQGKDDYYLDAFDILKGYQSDPSDYHSQWYAVKDRLDFKDALIRCE